MQEVWKPINGYEKFYQISNLGRVLSLYQSPPLILKQQLERYYQVTLYSKPRKFTTIRIHVLVWDHFGNRARQGRKLQIDHIDENRLNNKIENLQLLTQRENDSKKCLNSKKTSKYVGVCWHKRKNKWMSAIRIDSYKKYLGYFNDEHKAHLAYQKALKTI